MAVQAGDLLWNRRHLTLPAGVTVVNTGLRQSRQGMSPDPPLGATPGVTPSRVMVIPLAPTPGWTNLTHLDPVVNVDGIVEVTFTNAGAQVTINVLFVDPHTAIGPVSAELYV